VEPMTDATTIRATIDKAAREATASSWAAQGEFVAATTTYEFIAGALGRRGISRSRRPAAEHACRSRQQIMLATAVRSWTATPKPVFQSKPPSGPFGDRLLSFRRAPGRQRWRIGRHAAPPQSRLNQEGFPTRDELAAG
jgi:hypothetical protein